ncbi:MAG: hypothetical protein ARM1_0517 [Candidatus Micrarchaeota archaeon]|nr:MAG: hypothetical protein ARM1_0517 [Candidatus Micrarchaeota archaeon]
MHNNKINKRFIVFASSIIFASIIALYVLYAIYYNKGLSSNATGSYPEIRLSNLDNLSYQRLNSIKDLEINYTGYLIFRSSLFGNTTSNISLSIIKRNQSLRTYLNLYNYPFIGNASFLYIKNSSDFYVCKDYNLSASYSCNESNYYTNYIDSLFPNDTAEQIILYYIKNTSYNNEVCEYLYGKGYISNSSSIINNETKEYYTIYECYSKTYGLPLYLYLYTEQNSSFNNFSTTLYLTSKIIESSIN